MSYLVYIIAGIACTIGAICGFGGGVIIKPMMDLLCDLSNSTISFLSSCTVLTMSLYTAIKSAVNKKLKFKEYFWVAFGAMFGGITGKKIFEIIKNNSSNPNRVGVIQSLVMAFLLILVVVYTINKNRIHTLLIKNNILKATLGCCLGMFSAFLGIGGGQINIVVLHYFLSMDSKEAASCSLFIILFSQIASLCSTIVSNKVPEFEVSWLILLVISGILGGIIGRRISDKIDNKTIDKIFLIVVSLIVFICLYNGYNYAFIK